MKPLAKLFVWVSISLATLSMGCAQMNGGSTAGTGSTTPTTSSSPSSIVTTGPDRMSHGTQGDSLAACLARIPSDASAGQRMVATGTCERDAANRTPIDVVPGQ